MARRYIFICNCCEREEVCESESPPQGWMILVVPQIGTADLCSRDCMTKTLDQVGEQLAALPPPPPPFALPPR